MSENHCKVVENRRVWHRFQGVSRRGHLMYPGSSFANTVIFYSVLDGERPAQTYLKGTFVQKPLDRRWRGQL